MNKSCNNRLLIYSSTGITGAVTGSRVTIPHNIEEWYVKLTATETSAGSITPTLFGNETDSTTNPMTIEAFGAITATGVTRQVYSAADSALLPGYLYLDLATVSGTFDITLELFYSRA